eukprot:6178599-Pleurochrysis_carterae.AAC.1
MAMQLTFGKLQLSMLHVGSAMMDDYNARSAAYHLGVGRAIQFRCSVSLGTNALSTLNGILIIVGISRVSISLEAKGNGKDTNVLVHKQDLMCHHRDVSLACIQTGWFGING